MILTIQIAVGFILDLILGDPLWLPHPIVYIGKAISILKKKIQKKLYGCVYQELSEEEKHALLREEKRERFLGMLLSLTIVIGTFLIVFFVLWLLEKIHPWLRYILETFWIYQILATKCLKTESMKVYKKLREGDLKGARVEISYLVGRDTQSLSEEEVAKATIETVAENTSDGVIAPLFYIAIFGAPLGLAYKAINTLDSMIGYKNDEFINLGRFAAKLDDVANFIPARLCAIMMMLGSLILGFNFKGSVKIFRRDRFAHLSPNSAQTESVAAGALDIQLGGTHDYFGKPVVKPTIGDNIRPVEYDDIKKCNQLLYAAAILMAISSILIRILCMISLTIR